VKNAGRYPCQYGQDSLGIPLVAACIQEMQRAGIDRASYHSSPTATAGPALSTIAGEWWVILIVAGLDGH
jgi:hypothetical protein